LKVAIGIVIFLLAIVALAAEGALYFGLGIGAALTRNINAIPALAFVFVALMIVTGATGIIAPIAALIETLTKKKNLGLYILLAAIGLTIVLVGVIGLSTGMCRPSRHVPAVGAASGDSMSGVRSRSEYLSKVVVRDTKVGKSVLDEKGVWGEVKNGGDSTLDRVEITIFFLDSAGKPVHEMTYPAVLVSEYSLSGDNTPLKPGYSRKFGARADDAPSDWAGKVEIKVTDVQFSHGHD
jgi:hypothetical protein